MLTENTLLWVKFHRPKILVRIVKSDIEPQQTFNNHSLVTSPEEMIFKYLLSLTLAQLAVAQYGAPAPSSTAATPAPSAPPDTAGQHNVGIQISSPYVANGSYRSTFSRTAISSLILRISPLKLAILLPSTFQSSFT